MKSINEMTAEELKIHLFKLHPAVLLASIPDNISDNNPALIELMQAAYDKEYEAFKRQFTGAEIASLEYEYIKEQRNKLTDGDSMQHSRATRIKVGRYLKFLDTKEKAATGSVPAKKKPCKSLRRVYAFIIVEAHSKKIIDVLAMGRTGLIKYIEETPQIDASGNTVCNTVIGGSKKYPKEKAFINYFHEMARTFSSDYDYAMTLFKEVYPTD